MVQRLAFGTGSTEISFRWPLGLAKESLETFSLNLASIDQIKESRRVFWPDRPSLIGSGRSGVVIKNPTKDQLRRH